MRLLLLTLFCALTTPLPALAKGLETLSKEKPADPPPPPPANSTGGEKAPSGAKPAAGKVADDEELDEDEELEDKPKPPPEPSEISKFIAKKMWVETGIAIARYQLSSGSWDSSGATHIMAGWRLPEWQWQNTTPIASLVYLPIEMQGVVNEHSYRVVVDHLLAGAGGEMRLGEGKWSVQSSLLLGLAGATTVSEDHMGVSGDVPLSGAGYGLALNLARIFLEKLYLGAGAHMMGGIAQGWSFGVTMGFEL